MDKIVIFLLPLLCVGCTLQKPSFFAKEKTPTTLVSNANTNENGNIIWADGNNEKFYMPDSKNTLTFITPTGLVIYAKAINQSGDGCDYFYKGQAIIKVCSDGEALLFNDNKMINSGYFNLHHSYN